MTKFFVLGWEDENIRLSSIIQKYPFLEKETNRITIPGSGHFYFNKPWYIDFAENDIVVCIKFGQIHDRSKLISAEDIIRNELVTPSGVTYEKISGNGVVICLQHASERYMAQSPPQRLESLEDQISIRLAHRR